MQIHRCQFYPWMPQPALCVKFNPSKTEIAVSREDNSIEIWTRNPYFFLSKVIPSFSATAQACRRLIWVADDRLLSAGWNAEIVEWDLRTLVPRTRVSSSGGPIWDMSLSHDGKMLVAACEDGTLRVFDVSDGQLIYVRSVALGQSRALSCSFFPTSSSSDVSSLYRVAVGDAKGRLHLVDLSSQQQQQQQQQQVIRPFKVKVSGAKVESPVWSVCALSDNVVATGDSMGYVQFWDAQFGTLLSSYASHKSSVLCLVASGTHTLFASGIDSKVTRFQKLNDGKWVPTVETRGHFHDVHYLDVGVSTLVSASADGRLGLYGLLSFGTKDAKHLFPYPHSHQSCVSVSEQTRIALCRLKDSVQLWRLGKPASLGPKEEVRSGAKLSLNRPHAPLIQIKPDVNLSLHFAEISPNGELVFLGNREGIKGYTVEIGPDGVTVSVKDLPDEFSKVWALRLCFSGSDENCVALATNLGEVLVYSLVDFSLVRTVTVHQQRYVAGIAFKGKMLCSYDDESVVAVHSLDGSAEPVCVLPKFELPITALSFHPTRPWLVIACLSDRIYVYDYEKKQHSPWSINVGDKLDTKLIPKYNYRSSIMGFAFAADRVLAWGTKYVNVVDINTVSNKVQRVERYQDIVTCKTLSVSSNEVVVFERPWEKVLAELPPPLQRNRYMEGTTATSATI